MNIPVELYADFVCPFSCVAFAALRRAANELGVDVDLVWHGLPVRAQWPIEGVSAARVYADAGAAERRAKLYDALRPKAAAVGIEFRPPSIIASSRHALEAMMFEMPSKTRLDFAARVFEANFVEDHNIGPRTAVMELADQAGVDQRALADAFESGELSRRLDASISMSRAAQINGIPHMIVGRIPLDGVQPTVAIRDALSR